MGKITQPHEIRVIVFPPTFDEVGEPYTQEQLFQMAATLANEVRDRVPGADAIHVDFQEADVCSFCGALWLDPEKETNGCCLLDELGKKALAGPTADTPQCSPHIFVPYGFLDRFSQFGRCKHCLWPKRKHPVEAWAPARALYDGRSPLILPPTA